MLLIVVFCTILTSTSSIILPAEFWAEVGPGGHLIDATEDSLVSPRLDEPLKFMQNIEYASFVASRYKNSRDSFSQFGAAQKMENGTYCAWFPTSRESNEKVCSNFRILSMSKRLRNLTLFRWKPVYFKSNIALKGRIRIGNHFAGAHLTHQSVGLSGFHAGYISFLQFGDYSEIGRESVAVWTAPRFPHSGLHAKKDAYFLRNSIVNASSTCGDGAFFKHNFPCLFLLHFDQSAIIRG